MAKTTTRPANLGRAGGELAACFAWLTSPAAIAAEIARLEAALQAGDATEATRALLADWRAIQRAQCKLVAQDEEAR